MSDGIINEFWKTLAGCLLDLYVGHLADKAKDLKELKKLHDDISDFIEHNTNMIMACDSIETEIDTEGLINYINGDLLSGYLQLIKIFSMEERDKFIESMVNKACYYSHANKTKAKSKVRTIIINCIYVIDHFYIDKNEPQTKVLAGKIVEEFTRNQNIGNDKIVKSVTDLQSSLVNKGWLFNEDVFLDKKEEYEKCFVDTGIYYKTLDALNRNRVVILTGNPGCGKTVTSIMVAYEKVRAGYNIIYIYDHNISDIKSILSHNDSLNQIILLDDCFGQRYLEMKEGTGRELTALIKYVKRHKNTLLLMNSRITIFREAQALSNDFEEVIQNEELEEVIININDLSAGEKAKIFCSHLVNNEVPRDYIDAIKYNYNYRKIVKHKNYMPRLINSFTAKNIIKSCSADQYVDYIMSVLNDPELIWKNEYENRISDIDRGFINILYSLTNLHVDSEIHKRAFWAYIKNKNIDFTVDVWAQSKYRLANNMIKIIDINGKEYLSVADPSVNDYLDNCLMNNTIEISYILSCATEYEQIKRLRPESILKMVKDGSALELNYSSEDEKNSVLIPMIIENQILSDVYKSFIIEFCKKPSMLFDNIEYDEYLSMFLRLLQSPFNDKYNTKGSLEDSSIKELLNPVGIDEYYMFFKIVEKSGLTWIYKEYESVILDSIYNAICNCLKEATVGEYYYEDDNYIIDNYGSRNEYGIEVDLESVAPIILENVKENIAKEILDSLKQFPNPFNDDKELNHLMDEYLYIDEDDVKSYLRSILDENADAAYNDFYYDYYKEMHANVNMNEDTEIDYVFNSI